MSKTLTFSSTLQSFLRKVLNQIQKFNSLGYIWQVKQIQNVKRQYTDVIQPHTDTAWTNFDSKTYLQLRENHPSHHHQFFFHPLLNISLLTAHIYYSIIKFSWTPNHIQIVKFPIQDKAFYQLPQQASFYSEGRTTVKFFVVLGIESQSPLYQLDIITISPQS